MPTTAPVQYFEFADLLPGVQHFHCDATRASLSVDACARNWREVNEERREGACSHCKGCPIGAMHAGADEANLHPLHGTRTCGRCLRKASRLIKKHLCVSCQNREYEYLKGCNRKGTLPVTHPPLSSHSITYTAGDEQRTRTIELSKDRAEVIVAILRDERDAVRFVEKCDRVFAAQVESLCERAKRTLLVRRSTVSFDI